MAARKPGYHLVSETQKTPADLISYVGLSTPNGLGAWGRLTLSSENEHFPFEGILFPYRIGSKDELHVEVFPSFDLNEVYTTSRFLLPQARARVPRGVSHKGPILLKYALDASQLRACSESFLDLQARFQDGIWLDRLSGTEVPCLESVPCHPQVNVLDERLKAYSTPVELTHRFADGRIPRVSGKFGIRSSRGPIRKKRLPN